jgi:hypothetical protein
MIIIIVFVVIIIKSEGNSTGILKWAMFMATDTHYVF